ncbi:hypothetical protein [Variovorax sp. GT1P44]|uniref:hypothetical protein n=1 Tax=Variovorax sp. GT1P44 TaxID=3443742 RepID=UPI003F462D6D
MKTIVHVIVTLAGVLSCVVALCSASSLLLESLAGERRDFGTWGISMLAILIVGQCRALWAVSGASSMKPRRASQKSESVSDDSRVKALSGQ